MKKLLELLKSGRVKNGYSQEYLAEIMGVSSSRISRWKNGKTEMTLQQIHSYAHKIGISSTTIYAFLAHNGHTELLPIAEIQIEVFTEEAFKRITEVVFELGLNHATIATKRLVTWK